MFNFFKKKEPIKSEPKKIVTKTHKELARKTVSMDLGCTEVTVSFKDGRVVTIRIRGEFDQCVKGSRPVFTNDITTTSMILQYEDAKIYSEQLTSSIDRAKTFMRELNIDSSTSIYDSSPNFKEMWIGEVVHAKIGNTVSEVAETKICYLIDVEYTIEL